MNENIFLGKQEIKLVIFQIDNQQFALPLSDVERAIQIVELRELPNSPKYVCGIINMHGQIISVINLRALFGLPAKELELSDQLLIVSTSKVKLALWIDLMHQVIGIEESDIVRSEVIKYGDKSVQGVIKLESGIILLNDVDKFLSPEELKELELAILEVNI